MFRLSRMADAPRLAGGEARRGAAWVALGHARGPERLFGRLPDAVLRRLVLKPAAHSHRQAGQLQCSKLSRLIQRPTCKRLQSLTLWQPARKANLLFKKREVLPLLSGRFLQSALSRHFVLVREIAASLPFTGQHFGPLVVACCRKSNGNRQGKQFCFELEPLLLEGIRHGRVRDSKYKIVLLLFQTADSLFFARGPS